MAISGTTATSNNKQHRSTTDDDDCNNSISNYTCTTDFSVLCDTENGDRNDDDDDDDNKDNNNTTSKYTWDQLNALERRRRAILKRVELPFWHILTYWDGTCLKVMIQDFLLWITLAIYISIRIMIVSPNNEHIPDYLVSLGNTNIDIIGGFLSFFLVLFVNQANSRFSNMYRKSMDVTSQIEDVAAVASCYFPNDAAHRIVRYLNGAQVAGYVGLASDTYTTKSFFHKLNKKYKLLTKNEVQRVVYEIGLEQEGCSSMNEILMWCIKEIQLQQISGRIDARMSGELRGSIQKIRNDMESLYQDKDQPIHFFYIHFLCILTAFYLPLFAITNAYGVSSSSGDSNIGVNYISEIVSGLIVLLQAIFVIGLRLLGQVMVDPYGDDLEDLSVIHYIEHTWLSSNRILQTRFPNELNRTEEDTILQTTKNKLGRAWDDGNNHECDGERDGEVYRGSSNNQQNSTMNTTTTSNSTTALLPTPELA